MAAKGTPGLPPELAGAAGRLAPGAHVHSTAALVLILTVLVVICYVVYRVSLWRHPFVMCRRCGGSGKITGFLPWSRAFCHKCNGSGLRPRWGTHLADLRGRYSR